MLMVVLHSLNVFKCNNDVMTAFLQWERKGLIESGEFGETCQRV